MEMIFSGFSKEISKHIFAKQMMQVILEIFPLPHPYINPNDEGVDCAQTFFGQLFLHEKGVLRSQIS